MVEKEESDQNTDQPGKKSRKSAAEKPTAEKSKTVKTKTVKSKTTQTDKKDTKTVKAGSKKSVEKKEKGTETPVIKREHDLEIVAYPKQGAKKRGTKKKKSDLSSRIRIRLRAYDHYVLDQAVEDIVEATQRTGGCIAGPIPLPTRREIYTVNRSPHVDKKSREQFQMETHKRLIDILVSSAKTIDALKSLTLPAGVEIKIKVS